MDKDDAPYAYSSTMWGGLDTPRSAKNKAQYILDQGLGGAMFWELSTDDFNVGYLLILSETFL